MTTAGDALVLRGRPEALEAPLPGMTWDAATTAPQARLDVAGGEAPVTALVTLPGSTRLVGLRVVLPDDTPPGTYGGTLLMGDREFPLQAEVTGRAGLTLLPAEIDVNADGQTGVVVQVTAVNTGNVDLDLPEAQGVGLFAKAGFDRALGRALSGRKERGLERFDELGTALGEEHGGMLVMRTAEGAGALKPGEIRQLRLEARLPPEVRAGEVYFGFWHAAGASTQIVVNVQESAEVPG